MAKLIDTTYSMKLCHAPSVTILDRSITTTESDDSLDCHIFNTDQDLWKLDGIELLEIRYCLTNRLVSGQFYGYLRVLTPRSAETILPRVGRRLNATCDVRESSTISQTSITVTISWLNCEVSGGKICRTAIIVGEDAGWDVPGTICSIDREVLEVCKDPASWADVRMLASVTICCIAMDTETCWACWLFPLTMLKLMVTFTTETCWLAVAYATSTVCARSLSTIWISKRRNHYLCQHKL